MAKAVDVANFFITQFRETDDPMTKVRVQKFMFFAQAEALVRLGHPLFREEFKAWHYGPVIPSVGNKTKDIPNGEPIKGVIGEYDIHTFSVEEIEVLMDVSVYCGRYSTAELSRITHVPGGPWDSVHEENGKAETITKDSIREYYSKHRFVSSPFRDAVSKLPVEGYIDADGKTVLSSDWE